MPVDCLGLYKICVYSCKTASFNRPINFDKDMSSLERFRCLFFLRIFEESCKPVSKILTLNDSNY